MRRLLTILLFIAGSVAAQESSKIKVGLALQGGGALGFAHIGALHVIDSVGIPVSYVAGTSMGGLIGALYAMGYSTADMEAFVLDLDWNDIFNDSPSRETTPYLVKSQAGKYQLEIDFSGVIPILPSGIVAGQKIYKTFFTFTYPFEGIKSFDDLPIPFRCVGADLVSGNEIIFSDGSLAKAMRATMSIPTAFTPVRYDTAMVIDGGMINNFPVDIVKKMGSDFVIGLNLVGSLHDADYYDDLIKIVDRTLDVPRKDKLQETVNAADLLIRQNISGYSLSDFDKNNISEIVKRGKKAALDVLDELNSLKNRLEAGARNRHPAGQSILSRINLDGDPQFSEERIEKILGIKRGMPFNEKQMTARIERFNRSTHLAEIAAKALYGSDHEVTLKVTASKNLTPLLKEVRVIGAENVSEEFILNFLGLKPQKKIDIREFEHSVSLLYGLKYFSAIRYMINQQDDGTISLTLEVAESSLSRFKFGLHYDDFYKLVGSMGISGTTTLIPGLFYDFYLQFSGLTRFGTEIFYPTKSIDFPVYPFFKGGYTSIPRDIFDFSGQKLLRYDERYWYLAGGVGITPINFLNMKIAALLEYPNLTLDIGAVDPDSLRINENIVALNTGLVIDLLDDVVFPKDGLRVECEIEYSSTKFNSNYHYLRFNTLIDFYKTIASIHTIRISGQYMQSWEKEPFYKTSFFIGGPQSFYGMEYNQAIGQRFAIIRTDYLIRVLAGIYMRAAVNTAPYYRLGLPGDTTDGPSLWGFGLGFIYQSILGPLELSFAWGEKNTYAPGTYIPRIFLTAGYNL